MKIYFILAKGNFFGKLILCIFKYFLKYDSKKLNNFDHGTIKTIRKLAWVLKMKIIIFSSEQDSIPDCVCQTMGFQIS